MNGFNKSQLVLTLSTLLFFGSILVPASAYPTGITGVSLGCVCHSGNPTETVTITLEGVPENYSAGDEVLLTVTIIGGPNVTNDSINSGGFNLRVTGGTLTPVNNTHSANGSAIELVQIVGGEATHTEVGNDQRSWQVKWIAPQVEDLKIHFFATGNAVNGDGDPNSDDQWNQIEVESTGINYGKDSDGLAGFTFALLLLALVMAGRYLGPRYP